MRTRSQKNLLRVENQMRGLREEKENLLNSWDFYHTCTFSSEDQHSIALKKERMVREAKRLNLTLPEYN